MTLIESNMKKNFKKKTLIKYGIIYINFKILVLFGFYQLRDKETKNRSNKVGL